MASSKDYLNFVLEQLSGLSEISFRPMMGEFIIYYRGKIVGGIYDDRLLVKPVKAALSYLWMIKSFCRDCSLRCMGSCQGRKGRIMPIDEEKHSLGGKQK